MSEALKDQHQTIDIRIDAEREQLIDEAKAALFHAYEILEALVERFNLSASEDEANKVLAEINACEELIRELSAGGATVLDSATKTNEQSLLRD